MLETTDLKEDLGEKGYLVLRSQWRHKVNRRIREPATWQVIGGHNGSGRVLAKITKGSLFSKPHVWIYSFEGNEKMGSIVAPYSSATMFSESPPQKGYYKKPFFGKEIYVSAEVEWGTYLAKFEGRDI